MSFLDNILESGNKKPEQPKPRGMILRPTGRGESAHYPLTSYATSRMEWAGKDGSVRIPQQTSKKYPSLGGFDAAGKHYWSTKELSAEADETQTWCRDKYGREVFCIQERFPCFDSYDYMNENRYYRWWFIREGNVLTRIYTTDGREGIFVTEDVQDLENKCWETMCQQGYCCEK